jgi:Tfp pilus assembly protein PilW
MGLSALANKTPVTRAMPYLKRPQSGESLISLMIGLLISVVVALAMLSMFKVASRNGGQAGQDAAADAQLTSALLRAGIAAQDAGFGIATPTLGTQLKVIASATLTGATLSGTAASSTGAGNVVIWAMKTGSVNQCAGLYFKDASDGTGGLYYLGPVACSTGDLSSWNTMSWTSARWADRPANQSTDAYISFTLDSASCKPFGLDGSSIGAVMLTISGKSRSDQDLAEKQCLFNFKT